MGFFDLKSKDKTVSLEPMLTPEQLEAMKLLQAYGATGKLGDFQAGEAYGGSLGNYDQTGTEKIAGNKLLQLLNSGTAGLDEASGIFSRIANQGFDPNDPEFQAFKTATLRQANESADVLNRDATSMGSFFNSGLNKERGLLAERTQQDLSGKLGSLFNTAKDRSLQAAGGLIDTQLAKENVNQSRIQQGFDLGGLERVLKNAEAQAKYAEFQRQRNERLGSIDSLNTVLNKNVEYGMKSITLPGGPTPFGKILGSALKAGGTALGSMFGPAGAQIGGMLGGIAGDSLTGTDSGTDGMSAMWKNLLSMGSGNVPGTGFAGTNMGGKTMSEILGLSTAAYR